MEHELASRTPDAVRIFVRTTDGETRSLLHFRGRGEDIYWGAPGKGQPFETTVQQLGNDLSITVGREVGDRVEVKTSYHESGQVHVKQGGIMSPEGPMFTSKPRDLTRAVRAGLMWSKVPTMLPVYSKPIPPEGSVVLKLDEEAEQRRLLLEVFFAPAGQVDFPPYLNGRSPRRDPDFAVTVTARLLVVGWVTAESPEMSRFHPDKTILIAGSLYDEADEGGEGHSPA